MVLNNLEKVLNFSSLKKAPFSYLHVVYSLPFLIYMLFTAFWKPSCIKFTCYLRVSWLNHKKFTGYLQYVQEQFTCHLHDLSPFLWKMYSVLSIIYMFHLWYLHDFYMEP